jgi:hypothetical protein
MLEVGELLEYAVVELAPIFFAELVDFHPGAGL